MTENWRICASSGYYIPENGKLKLSELTCRLLANRGLKKEADIKRYLFPSFEHLYPSEKMSGAKEAASIIAEKIRSRKKIRVIGDYDVDGIVSTFILTDTLRKLGADADYAIPDRIAEGYGLNISLIERAIEDGCNTVITCDNGIAAIKEIEYAKQSGLTVIVTDHHEIPETIPAADVVIDPKLETCTYPFRDICGAVVAAKTADMITKEINGQSSVLRDYIAELALATVCDVMDLCDENRTIVKLGLEKLSAISLGTERTDKQGLSALIERTGLSGKKLNAVNLGFVLGPCINATGRLDTADRGVRLLLTNDRNEAAELADELANLNEERKKLTDEQVGKAMEIVGSDEYKTDTVLLIYLKNCHESIAGIIAGKIKEKVYRPVIVFTDSNGLLKGSGRSIEGYNMFGELSKFSDLYEKFGGHEMAAGLSVKPENFEPLRKGLNKNISLTEEELMPKVLIDGVVSPNLLDIGSVAELSLLEPFGRGNRKPLLAVKNAKIKRLSTMGKQGRYLRFLLDFDGCTVTAVFFGDSEAFRQDITAKYGYAAYQALLSGTSGQQGESITVTLAYTPSINEYMGNRELQAVISNYRV